VIDADAHPSPAEDLGGQDLKPSEPDAAVFVDGPVDLDGDAVLALRERGWSGVAGSASDQGGPPASDGASPGRCHAASSRPAQATRRCGELTGACRRMRCPERRLPDPLRQKPALDECVQRFRRPPRLLAWA
jgi:hypothetical protein